MITREYRSKRPSAVLIAGPTASGKSGLAMRLAEEIGGTVINADSMQVYRELSIITARPTEQEMSRVPHRLYGVRPSAEAYSVGQYLADAAHAIAEERAAGRVPILVGGTGLYFKALLEGLSPLPPIDPAIRAKWRARADEQGAELLHAELKLRDPETATRLMPTDKQRLVRALEVLESTGQSLGVWQKMPGIPVLQEAETLRLLVVADRDRLMQRIDQRFDAMLAMGALEEIRAFAQLDLSHELPAVRAHGVRPLMAYLRNEISLAAAAEGSKAETRQYAKRQVTWHRRNMMSWRQVTTQLMERIDGSGLSLDAFGLTER